MILFIIFPPGPITSFILSTLIFVLTILGAYFDTSALGLSITGIIMSFNIYDLALAVLSNASSIILYVNPSHFISTCIAVIPFSVPPTLKSISPKKSSKPWISTNIT